MPLSESNPVFAIDIGAGVTSVAAFSLDGIIAGLSMNVGGSNMDVHIIDHIADTFSLKIGALTSEKLKNTVGSLIEDDNQSTIINGRDIKSGRPRSVSVSSADIVFPIKVYNDKIAEYADLVLKKLPCGSFGGDAQKRAVSLGRRVQHRGARGVYVEETADGSAPFGRSADGGRLRRRQSRGNAALLRRIRLE